MCSSFKNPFALSTTAALLALALAGGCQKKEEASPGAAGPKSAATNRPPASATATNAMMLAAEKSVFDAPPSAKDPFFPKSKRNPEAAATGPGSPALPPKIDAISLLNLQGILGVENNRIAVVNNTMVEAGKRTTVTVSAAGQEVKLKVRCKEITRNSVILEVDGQPSPIELRMARR